MNNIIGFIAAIFTTAAFIPQAYKVFRTKKTKDISTGMFVLMSAGVALWTVYGFMIDSLPIVTANSVTLILAVYILAMKINLDWKN